jgi:protease PrsW
LFTWSTRDHFAITGRLVAAFAGVSLPHAPWGSMPMISTLTTLLLTGEPWQYESLLQGTVPAPTATRVACTPRPTGWPWPSCR